MKFSSTTHQPKLESARKAFGNPNQPQLRTPRMNSYAKGTSFVPKTGKVILHKGEAVIPAKKNSMAQAEAALGAGKSDAKTEEKSDKRVKSVHVRKAHNGGFISEVHAHDGSMDEHTLKSMKTLQEHMKEMLGKGQPESDQEQAQGDPAEEQSE